MNNAQGLLKSLQLLLNSAQGLMNNSTWAESDVRRGLTIGVSIGAVLGTSLGCTLFHLLEMPTSIGVLLGGIMGTAVGALMSGIVGAGLVHPKLKQVIKHLEVGQAAITQPTLEQSVRSR